MESRCTSVFFSQNYEAQSQATNRAARREPTHRSLRRLSRPPVLSIAAACTSYSPDHDADTENIKACSCRSPTDDNPSTTTGRRSRVVDTKLADSACSFPKLFSCCYLFIPLRKAFALPSDSISLSIAVCLSMKYLMRKSHSL